MEDRLSIIDLELWTHIGVPADERMTEQRLLVTRNKLVERVSVAVAGRDSQIGVLLVG